MLALGLLAPPLSADDAPWGFGPPDAPAAEAPASRADLLRDLYTQAVAAYRSAGDRDSVHRCAFGVSCSHFADRSFLRYGMGLGLVVLVDRYFYRENQAARSEYPLVELPDGTFRSDDAFFVP